MNKIVKIVAVFSALFLIQGCGSDDMADSKSENTFFSVMHSENYTSTGAFTSKGARIFSSSENYENELVNYSADEPYSINFLTSRVLLIDMGRRNTGGYSIEVSQVNEHEEYIEVTVVLSTPSDHCIVTHALTNPYQFIEVTNSKELLVKEEFQIKKRL